MDIVKRIFAPLLAVSWLPFFAGMVHAVEGFEVVAGIAPYAYLAERIGGDNVRVQTLIEQSQDPHTFEPSPKKIMSLGSARLFLLSGLDFEERLTGRIQNSFPGLTFVDLSKGLEHGGMAQKNDGPDQHGDSDQHAWLSPPRYRRQAEIVTQAFSREDPKHKDVYSTNLAELQKEIDQITDRIARQLEPFQGRSFFVFHPAFAHFGEAFGLHQKAVEVGGRLPTPKKIAGLIEAAKEEKVQIIFVQPQFDQASAKVVASSIGGAVVGLDPLAKDVLHNYAIIADQLEKAFQ